MCGAIVVSDQERLMSSTKKPIALLVVFILVLCGIGVAGIIALKMREKYPVEWGLEEGGLRLHHFAGKSQIYLYVDRGYQTG